MLKKQLVQLISDMIEQKKIVGNDIELYKEEKDFVEKNQLLPHDFTIREKEASSRFSDAYIERSDKESEEVIAEEGYSFLNQSIDYLHKHMNEFVYLESSWLELIGVDSVSLEVDDVFRTFDVMLGLKIKKKFESNIKNYLIKELNDEANFDLMFNSDEGILNLNFDLNSVEGFKNDMTFGEAFGLIYQLLFKLVDQQDESIN